MSTLRQVCPSCKRSLELPSEAEGRLAKCPACQATFTAHADLIPPAQQQPPQPAAQDPSESPAADPAPTQPQRPVSENPFVEPLESGPAPTATPNPYAPAAYREPIQTIGELPIVDRSIEEVFSPTLAIFAQRWSALLIAFIVVGVGSFVTMFASLFLFAMLSELGQEVGAVVSLVLLVPVGIFASAYFSVGICRNAIAVARNSPTPLAELLPPLSAVFRFLVGALAMAVFVGIFVGVFVGILAALGASGNDELMGVIGVLGGLFFVVVGTAAYWLLWAWMFIASDGKATAIGSIRGAISMTMHNKLTSFLLVVIATALSTAGAAACYVGLLVTYPLTNLMFAVAYMLMSNQRIDDPRAYRDPYSP
ncbi:MAG: hypothetical protein AB8B91_24670 [Rubripirellula sp.]